MQVSKSLSEYIAAPITNEEQQMFEKQRQSAQVYEYKVVKWVGAFSILIGMSVMFLILQLEGAWYKHIFIGFLLSMAAGLMVFLPALLRLGGMSLARYPMTLIIDDTNYIMGTVGDEFEPVSVDKDKLRGSDLAVNLYESIAALGRPVFDFEKRLMNKLCKI
jgi:hypothetical protein